MLQIIQKRAYNAPKLDWPSLRKRMLSQAATATTNADVYPLINSVLAQLQDHHSFLILSPDESTQTVQTAAFANFAGLQFQNDKRTIRKIEVHGLAEKIGLHIGDVITQLKPSDDGGSLIITARRPNQAPVFQVSLPVPVSPPEASKLPSGQALCTVSYLNLPGNDGSADPKISYYATAAHILLRKLEAKATCGWVIDLRMNGGGNSYPMLASVGPLAGERLLFSFQERGNRKTFPVTYQKGAASLAGKVVAQVKGKPFIPVGVKKAVAVLIGPQTLSGGEVTALVFRGLNNSRSFGLQTGGALGYQTQIPLEDRATLLLATGVAVDRSGLPVLNAIRPDVEIPFENNQIGKPADPVLKAAIAWLRQKNICFADPK